MSHQTYTRRAFLGLLAGGTATILGNARVQSQRQLEPDRLAYGNAEVLPADYLLERYSKQSATGQFLNDDYNAAVANGLDKKPLFRAASLCLLSTSKDPSGDKEYSRGQGGLYKTTAGDLVIQTVEHVVQPSKQQGDKTYVFIPGICTLLVNSGDFHRSRGDSHFDGPVSFRPTPDVQDYLAEQVSAGNIEPLAINRKNKIMGGFKTAKDYVFADPRSATFVKARFEQHSGLLLAYNESVFAGALCQGVSGGPLLEATPDGIATNVAVGVMERITDGNDMFKDNILQAYCSTRLTAVEF